MIVTTSIKPSEQALAQADRLAAELSAVSLPRSNLSVRKLLAASQDRSLIVVTEREVRYYSGQSDTPLFFHPSMALIRVKRMRNGESDPLIELSRCREGDQVIDCTAGLGSDSLVFSYAAGSSGNVLALESEQVLCTLVREGLSSYKTGLSDVDAAMRRIDMRCADHLAVLKGLPSKSADIIYFDPMFRKPIHESSSIEPLRTIANRNALTEEVIAHAQRVARRTVLLKEHRESDEFARLGFERRHVNTSKIAYGVIEVE